MTDPAPLERLVESYVDTRWHLDPVDGSGAGRADCDGRLGSFGEDSVRRHLAALRALMAAIEELDVTSLEDEIDRTALLYDVRVAEHRFRVEQPHRRDPGLWVSHALEGLYQLLVFQDRSGAARARAAVSRLEALPGFLDEAGATLFGCPPVLVDTARAAVQAGLGLVDDLVTALADAAGEEERFRSAAHTAGGALRAFEGQLAGLGYTQDSEEHWGVGRDALEFRLRHQHALSASTEELLRYASKLIDETEHELAVLARTFGAASWPEAFERLRADGPPGGSLVAAYRDVMQRSREHVRAHDLVSLVDGALDVVETPGYARPRIPVAAYLPPGPLSDDRTGRFFVTVPDGGGDPGDHARHAIPATVVHEGFPGHHLQFLTAYAQPRLVRRLLFAPIAVEGWALYAESLMEEAGFLADPPARFFQQIALLWRALRIPLDIGIHTGALSYADAVHFLTDRLHVSGRRAEAEVRRTYAEPAYQLAYAAGRRQLLALRDAYRRHAGSAYTARAFHDAVLSYGALPVSLVQWGLGLDA